MGALLALALACERPGQVRGLFLVDPVYAERGDPPRVLTGWTLALTRWVVGVLARSYLADGRLSRGLSRLIFRLAFTDAAARELAWIRQRTQVPLEYPRMLFESFEGVTGFPFRPFADELAVPTCVVEAASGRPSRFAALAARLRARLGERFRFESVRGGHYLQLDRAPEVSARLLAFAREAVSRAWPA
jgi:pimeloyl-ACP methyl ester carboxylesterase